MKRCFTVLSAILILVAVAAGGAVMMVEWAVGCGESWVVGRCQGDDAHQRLCVHPHPAWPEMNLMFLPEARMLWATT